MLGWSPGGVETYTVALITDPAEIDRAKTELTGGGPTRYVVLRVDEGEGSANRSRSLRMLIEDHHFLCRPPTAGEREAQEKRMEVLELACEDGRLAANPARYVRMPSQPKREGTTEAQSLHVRTSACMHQGCCTRLLYRKPEGKIV